MSSRFKNLMGNTVIFAIGSFSSKAMVFLLMPFYSRVLTDVQYGTADLITATSNLLIPFVMLSVNEAIVRYGLDRSTRKSDVFSVGLATVLAGFAIFCLLSPIMLQIKMISSYTLLIYLYVLAAALKSICAQFVRSLGLVRLYAFDGFLSTLTVVLLNILFLAVFKWGAMGYVLSIVLSNVLSVIFLFIVARLHRYINFLSIDRGLRREMLRYSIPLIPTTMFWWITSALDRYVIVHYWGEGSNGLYAAAHKLPALLTLVSAVFYQAWQISAVNESGQGEQTNRFYAQVYDHYSTLLFLAGSGLIMICRPFTSVWLGADFVSSWEFVPFLTIAEVFSTLVTFMGSFYMVSKRNATVPLAIAVGALANLVLNLLLVPKYGARGAALATVFCYLLAFSVRAFDVRRLVDIDLRLAPCAVNLLLLMCQTALLFQPGLRWPLLTQLGMFLLVCLVNSLPILRLLTSLKQQLALRRNGK